MDKFDKEMDGRMDWILLLLSIKEKGKNRYYPLATNLNDGNFEMCPFIIDCGLDPLEAIEHDCTEPRLHCVSSRRAGGSRRKESKQ